MLNIEQPNPSSLEGAALGGDGRETRMVLAASTGGHLAQLVRIAPSLGAAPDSLWITFDSPQARSLLNGRRTLFVPYVKPRDWKMVIRVFMTVLHKVSGDGYTLCASTGSAIALAVIPAMRLRRTPGLYIESVSRVQGPSVTGRVLACLRVCRLRTQHVGWSGRRWKYAGNVLQSFRSYERGDPTTGARPRIFVTLGTIRPYQFRSAVAGVMQTGLPDDSTTWQLGATQPDGELPGHVHQSLSSHDFERCARNADVVVTHAGVGTILQLLEWGIFPVVLVRRKARGEHVDDHQVQIAQLLEKNDLARITEGPAITEDDIRFAAKRCVRTVRTAGVDGDS